MPRHALSPRSTVTADGWCRALVVVALLVIAWLPMACGKMGPPLPPIVKTPAVLADFAVHRSGDTVYLRFTVPTSNTDNSTPADLSRIEVYAYTAVREIEGLEVRDLTLVSEVLVRRPPDPDEARDAVETPAVEQQPAAAKTPATTKTSAATEKPGVGTPAVAVAPADAKKPGADKPAVAAKPAVADKPAVTEKPTPAKTPAAAAQAAPAKTPAETKKPAEQQKPAAAKAPKKPRPPEPGVDQGAIVTVTEVLTPESMALSPLPKKWRPVVPKAGEPAWGSRLEMPAVGPVLEARPRRFYLAYTVNHRGQRGTPAQRFSVAFDPPPAPPGTPRFIVSGKVLEIVWDPPVGAAAAVEQPADASRLPATFRGMLLPVLPMYNIYVVSKTPAAGVAGGIRPPELPPPLNGKPLTTPSFVDDTMQVGVERCYQVRTVNTVGALTQVTSTATAAPASTAAPAATAAIPAFAESAPSPIACVTPADAVAPPLPTALGAVASTGAISLIWTGVEARDLAGYLVLRGTMPEGVLTPLFTTPIRETTYRDVTVKPGIRYVYAIVAVDTAVPPNRSPMSNKAEETAR